MAELPAGSKAVFSRLDELQHVLTPEGDSFVCGFDGQLSAARDPQVRENDEPVLLKTGDGRLAVFPGCADADRGEGGLSGGGRAV